MLLPALMANIPGLRSEADPGLIVCEIHGTGVHPDVEAIKRHLRGKEHCCKGKAYPNPNLQRVLTICSGKGDSTFELLATSSTPSFTYRPWPTLTKVEWHQR